MKKSYLVVALLLAFVAGMLSCEKVLTKKPGNDQILDGPIEGLTPEQNIIFLRGDKAFNDDIFSAGNGLGPKFVATSCGSCHAGDGKGHPFTTLTRFGQSDTIENRFLHLG